VPVEAGRTTDVVLLNVAPIALASVRRQLTLPPVPLDIGAVPEKSLLFPTLLNGAAPAHQLTVLPGPITLHGARGAAIVATSQKSGGETHG